MASEIEARICAIQAVITALGVATLERTLATSLEPSTELARLRGHVEQLTADAVDDAIGAAPRQQVRRAQDHGRTLCALIFDGVQLRGPLG
jgi:hypothetical protein